MNTYKDLTIWKKAMELVVEIYRLSKQVPTDERFSLTDQIRRAAVSIPSNIAEGKLRKSNKEFVQFLYIARGSTGEVETQLLLACKLGFIQTSEAQVAFGLCDEIGRMSAKLITQNDN